ncbi:hypothetical protein CH75_08400 [Dyella jiangningensis]|uniref:GYD domain-containing protein n=1 Tax=Dyella jiangningensis TaxID=1379159 RepID=UPI000456682B|nr:GYD domain-containing protein [Dyella jiangningensis]AHX13245.1 hypothetical protein CH75_08400 [Dyella jiangningensis]MDG2538830.1 GYD domain-containing protein [Dyella jiangningensis]
MSVFISQGRFTKEAVRSLLAKPEDRAESIAKLFSACGGKLISYYVTFGDYDFVVISEGPDEGVVTSTIVVSAAGEVSDLKTMLAIPSSEMKKAFAKAGAVAAKFQQAGAAAA